MTISVRELEATSDTINKNLIENPVDNGVHLGDLRIKVSQLMMVFSWEIQLRIQLIQKLKKSMIKVTQMVLTIPKKNKKGGKPSLDSS